MILKLWTYHPDGFAVDDRAAVCDPARGAYWDTLGQPYRDALAALRDWSGLPTYPLWCFSVPEQWMHRSLDEWPVEWELTGPDEEVLAYIHEPSWHDIVIGNPGIWDAAVSRQRPPKLTREFSVALPFPLPDAWQVIRRGPFPPLDCRNRLSRLRRLPVERQQAEIANLQRLATDPCLDERERANWARRLRFIRLHFPG